MVYKYIIMTYIGNHTAAVQRGLNLGVVLFIASEALFFLAIFWAFFHSALSPTVELGAQWPPLGIAAINPFELPLLNTVYRVIIFPVGNVAVLVKSQLYELNLTLNYCFMELPVLLSLPLSLNRTSRRLPHSKKGYKNLVSKNYFNSTCLYKFHRWFVGFSDAEGSFGITSLLNNKTNKIQGFSFKFTIGLHKDDVSALNIIKSKLGMGKIYSYNDKQIFLVTKNEDINKLISIFNKYTLNTSKYLDFLDFKLAFTVYQNRLKLTDLLISQILDFKNNMNTKRIHFNMPDNQVVLTKSWLLGFIEGDGSFNLERASFEPIFSIKLSESQLPLLLKIKDYLEKNLGFDSYSMHKLKKTSVISIRSEKARDIGKSLPLAALVIKNLHLLNNYLIPFLSEEEFFTKKGKDFLDFKVICKAIYNGAHLKKEIASLVLKLSYTMNNYRLSRYQGTVIYLSKNEMNRLINAKPTIEHLKDGRQRDLFTNKVIDRRSSSCIYEIVKPSEQIILMPNLAEAAQIIGTSFNTLKRHLDALDNIPDGVVLKDHTIKRIPVFYPIAYE